MFGTHFYNQRIRKSVAVFGTLFDNLYVVRKAGGTSVSQLKVPLSYGPKRKFLERIADMDNGEEAERQLAIKLPRMSFEMTSMAYDPTRQLPKNNSFKRSIQGSIDRAAKYNTGVPYILSFQLNVYAKSQDDALQVVEQVIPYFGPSYTLTIYPYDDVDDIKEDVQITLSSVSFSDDYEGDLAQRRTIIYTLDFEMKINFWGPAPLSGQEDKIIREINTNMYFMDAGLLDSDLFAEALQVTPNPLNVSLDSDYTFNTTVLDSAQLP